MSPEMLKGNYYVSQDADLFACGVILVILLCGHPPFLQASKTDKFYKPIISNHYDKFWANMKSDKPEGFFSPELIELLSFMLSRHPAHRLSLAEILTHPWVKGECPD